MAIVAMKSHGKKVMTMKVIYFLAGLSLSVSLWACAAVQSGGAIAQGRQALFEGDNQAALGYFQAAAQVDPNHLYGTELREGTFSFLGRAQYLTGDYTRAGSTLEKALAQHKDDNVARLYLGLTVARQGETQKSLQDIDAGMKGISDFLDYMTDSYRFSFAKEWDPGRDIRSAIERDRAMIASGKIDWQVLIADGEWIALKTEREPDLRLKPTVRD